MAPQDTHDSQQPEPDAAALPQPLTAQALLDSELVGMWEDRTDIVDSSAYALQLRREASQRAEQ